MVSRMNIDRLMRISPINPLGIAYSDEWYLAAIQEGRDQLLELQVVANLCRNLDSVDLSVAELKAALISAPGYFTVNLTNWDATEDAAVASYFARILLAGKSGAYGLPQARAANAD